MRTDLRVEQKASVERLHPDGFSLLELLLALGMTVMLLGVLFTALDLHWRFSLSGQEEVTRSQIARAVFTKMSHDIRSTIYRAKPKSPSSSDSTSNTDDSGTDSTSGGQTNGTGQSGTGQSNSGTGTSGQGSGQSQGRGQSQGTGTSGTGSSGSSSDLMTPKEPMLLSDAYSGSALGVFGDESSLVLHVVRPDRLKRGVADTAGTSFSSSDTKAVAYYLGDGSGSLATMFGLSTGGTQGLTRVSADRLSLSLASANTDLVMSASKTEVVAQEIESISFSYFDGAEWLSGWDSEVEGRLPNAIGVSITFRAPEGSATSLISRTASAMSESFRIVVTLPTANSFESLSF